MTLLIVQNDTEYVQVRRRGRFSLPRGCADSPVHLESAVRDAQEQMIASIRRLGYEYVDDGFELRGPLEHIEYSDSADPDPGPFAQQPDPRDREACERFERAEKARLAQAAGDPNDLVDFRLVATFRRAVPTSMRTLPASLQHPHRPADPTPPQRSLILP